MKKATFYILAVAVLALCILGACITADPPDEGAASQPGGNDSGSGTRSEEAEISDSPVVSSGTSAEESREPYTPPAPSVYPPVTDADIGPDEIDSFFNDSVFVGNSIMLHYKNNYTTQKRGSDSGFLGTAKFHASGSFSYYNNIVPVSADSVHPLYQGEKMKIEDAVAAMGAKTVYLSGMALNEIALFGTEESVRNLATVADAVKAKSPDVKIVVLANTYMTANFNNYQNKLNNGSISEYNNLLLDYCNENGYDFIDVATPLMENDVLADKFCSDNDISNSNCLGCHLLPDAYAIWTAVLRDYARAVQAGAYVNPDSMPVYGGTAS